MLDKCKVICSVEFAEGLIQGQEYEVLSVPLDKSKWYLVSEDNEWTLHEKWQFDHIVHAYATYEKYYGCFQLPIIDEDKYMVTVIQPTGYATMISKADCVITAYPSMQKINCGDVRFR